ncbi:acylneuraminate cytidylyltransferase [Rhodocytophaga rosea]|uniref:Acylneuraminate cytidylyltransferase n=1 Tax=Rhodocytophaga rosea TaxID=2704465 RepID=A0A6C0GL65_9BACT|nr:glycosyltransferase family protein [Rhodocytophaga rosea]QHT68821.1 acylneuraminate cytidylyltransferase [Rhodocytophaga rosea]
MAFSSPKVGIISQARMGSTRLPGKIMLEAKGKKLLQYHLERLHWSGYPVIIATTTLSQDDIIVEFCLQHNIPYYRGDEENVLSRFYLCAKQFKLDIIIRVTSDCPLIDGLLIKQAVEEYIAIGEENVYASNCLVRSYPRGFDFEIFSFALLKEAYTQASLPAQKEHVTPYLYQNTSGNIVIRHFVNDQDASRFRITLDTPEDYKLILELIETYYAETLYAAEIIKLLADHPELSLINAHIEQKKI